jgi:hypothetical protein
LDKLFMKAQEPNRAIDRLLAVVALVIALAAFLWPRSSKVAVEEEVKALRNEMNDLRGRLAERENDRVGNQSPSSAEPERADGVTLRQVHEWVWGLEQRLVQLEENMAATRTAAGPTPAPAPDVVQSRQVAVNPQASAGDRLAALRVLRAANARTSDVVQSMLQLQGSSDDPNVRADIFRQLSGVSDPAMKPHLINGVLKDADPKVREEAAETMGPFWSDPYVQAALKSAAQNDPDEKVREQAAETLEKRGRR